MVGNSVFLTILAVVAMVVAVYLIIRCRIWIYESFFSASHGKDSIADDIANLVKLRDRGDITPEQFDAAVEKLTLGEGADGVGDEDVTECLAEEGGEECDPRIGTEKA